MLKRNLNFLTCKGASYIFSLYTKLVCQVRPTSPVTALLHKMLPLYRIANYSSYPHLKSSLALIISFMTSIHLYYSFPLLLVPSTLHHLNQLVICHMFFMTVPSSMTCPCTFSMISFTTHPTSPSHHCSFYLSSQFQLSHTSYSSLLLLYLTYDLCSQL